MWAVTGASDKATAPGRPASHRRKPPSGAAQPTHETSPQHQAELPGDGYRDPVRPVSEYDFLLRSRAERLRSLPRLVSKALRLVWVAGRRELVVTTALQLLLGLGLIAQLLLGKSVLGSLLDENPPGGNFSLVVPELAALVALTVALNFANALQTEQSRVLGELVGRAASQRVLDVSAGIDLEAFELPSFFDRLQRAHVGSLTRPMQMVNGLMTLTTSLLSLAGLSAALAVIEPLLLPFILLGYAPLWYVATRNSKAIFELSLALTEDDRHRLYLQRLLTGRDEAKEIRSFGLTPMVRQRYDRLYAERIAKLRQVARGRFTRSMWGAFGISGVTVASLGLLGYLYTEGRMSLAGLGAAVAGLLQLGVRLRGVGDGVGTLYESALFVDDYEAFLDLLPQVPETKGNEPPLPPFSRIRAENITFTYPGAHRPALFDVSLDLEAGEVVALVGENGSGKTTLAKLLANLYRPDRGRILWDDIDTATCHPARVRQSIAVIFQDFVRYLFTARENIAAGRPQRLDDFDGVKAAAISAGADSFISRLPKGYETTLGKEFNGGSDLSIGQWQRVALARAFFRDAHFVILDEPTAALDPRSEYELFSSIRTLFEGRSVLLISHRFSSVRAADRIYVLDHGRVVEQGAHDDLVANEGLYAELFQMQASAYLGEFADDGASVRAASAARAGRLDLRDSRRDEDSMTGEPDATDTTVRLRENAVAWNFVADEIVALDLETSSYLGVNRSAAVLWPALAQGVTRQQLTALLVNRFDVDADQASSDIDALLRHLDQLGLLEEVE